MMNPPRQILRAAIVGAALTAALTACQKQEGPLEQAGKQVDQAVDKAGQQIEKTADEIQDAARRDKK
jgi:hypothetical protein